MEKFGLWIVLMLVVDVIIIVIAYLLISSHFAKRFKEDQESKASTIVLTANEKAREIELEARDTALKAIQEADAEVNRRRAEVSREEHRSQKRRTELDNRIERMEQREQTLNKRQSALDKRTNEVEKMAEQHLEELQRIGQMSMDDARGVLLQEAEKEARGDMARIIRNIEAEARSEGEKRARELIADSIQRVASDHVTSVTTSIVTLPNEEMKGRIVGRNGRNIRAFEQAAGVDVIVDDTPEAVTISCFDPIRREIARRTLTRLIEDGRIHPAHIEKVLGDETKNVDKDIVEAGEQAVYDAGIAGLHPEIIKVLGRLKFRTSYGQNQLAHAVETARLAAVLAVELG
ncbi:MAG TPA: Rnase Y domain-containing protein, partial [Bellilinea sp.]|nr:Rnase Y domain-containing protein [Bellilinea sp.]